MRLSLLFAAILVSGVLAGCNDSGDGDHDEASHTCPDGTEIHGDDFPDHHDGNFSFAEKCIELGHGPGGTRTPTPTPTSTPNSKPTAVLRTYNATGGENNTVLLGGTLTFDASASLDPDGTIEAAAVIIDDGNRSVTLSLTDEGGQLMPMSHTFDQYGPVNVTLNVVDNRGGLGTALYMVYVNFQMSGSVEVTAPLPNLPAGTDPCKGPTNASGSPLIDNNFYGEQQILEVTNSTTWIEAHMDAGIVAICDPSDASLSGTTAAADAVTATGTVFTDSTPSDPYKLRIRATNNTLTLPFSYTVHFDPQPA